MIGETTEVPARSASPRICMPTWRNFTNRTYRCGSYEAEDVLTQIDDVDLIRLDMGWGARFNEYWLRTPIYHDMSKKLVFANPGLKKTRLKRNYDVFIALFKTPFDIPYINAIERWKDHCKVSVCWLDELWAAGVHGYKNWWPALRQFDFIFVGLNGTAPALSEAIGRPCHWLPGGVDALRFSPFGRPAPRVIDVCSIGRRHDGIHREMLRAAERSGLFYVHDTHKDIAASEVHDHRQHREMFANVARRSRHFVVATAKMDTPDETRGQIEVGHRYFEGAAAGAVMIGDVPDCESYRGLFWWPDAVVPIQPDGSDVMAILNDLQSDPERVAAIGTRNAKEALLHHDWVYRWDAMFQIAGIEASPRKAARERRLQRMADIGSSAQAIAQMSQ